MRAGVPRQTPTHATIAVITLVICARYNLLYLTVGQCYQRERPLMLTQTHTHVHVPVCVFEKRAVAHVDTNDRNLHRAPTASAISNCSHMIVHTWMFSNVPTGSPTSPADVEIIAEVFASFFELFDLATRVYGHNELSAVISRTDV